MATVQEPSSVVVHWSEVRVFNIRPIPDMLLPNGKILRLTCLLKSESPRTTEAGKSRLVLFDRSYVVWRLQGLLTGFLDTVEQTTLVDLLAEVLKHE